MDDEKSLDFGGGNWRAHGASSLQVNNFALAIPVADATFDVESNQALAATVGPLIEVHIFLGVIYVSKWCMEGARGGRPNLV